MKLNSNLKNCKARIRVALIGARRSGSRSPISRTHIALTSAFMTLACMGLLAPTAQATTWRLSVSPRYVSPGGTVVIKTTARGCKLTLSEGSNHWHYKLSRGRNPFTISKTASPGVDYVTVNCGGRVKKSNFTIVGTPITVANVCNKNPGLGPHYPYVSQGVPTEYWTDSSGRLKLLLIEYSPTNIAVVVGPDGQSVAYFAYCNWQRWLTIAEYKAATGNTQSSNLGYLLQTQTDQAIFQMNDLWTTPSAGVQLCPSGPATYCDYEPVP